MGEIVQVHNGHCVIYVSDTIRFVLRDGAGFGAANSIVLSQRAEMDSVIGKSDDVLNSITRRLSIGLNPSETQRLYSYQV